MDLFTCYVWPKNASSDHIRLFVVLMISFVCFSSHASEKTPDFSKAQYCQNEELLSRLPNELNPALQANRIVVSKKQRRLFLISERGHLIKSYAVAFGFGGYDGPKSFEGDGKTPEGVYFISKKTESTSYHRALHISYPNKADAAFAKARGKRPGGLILIHGFPEHPIRNLTPEWVEQVHPETNWTEGCIAVTNPQIEEIYGKIREQTPIEICSP